MDHPNSAPRQDSSLRPVRVVALAMLLAGGLGLIVGGVTPVPTLRWPWSTDLTAGDQVYAVDADDWLDRSEPLRVDAEAVGLHAPLVELGMSPEGEFEVPPLSQPQVAGWFEGGSSPGEFGPTVLLGHVDTELSGPAVFFGLQSLEDGDLVELTREDGIVVAYEVTKVESYPKEELPYEEVFGIDREPVLRLITCGGRFDREAGDYTDNLVVYATYAGHREATEADRSRPLHDRDHFVDD